jgi:hypothetical protein
MSRNIQQIVAEIDGLPTVDGDDLKRLQVLMDEFFESPAANDHVDVWFRLFERFPDDDGYEMFWTILHGVESLPGSDAAVIASVSRLPTHFPVLMVNRMLNGGIASVSGRDLLQLLRQVAEDERNHPGVRADAQRFLAHQSHRTESK